MIKKFLMLRFVLILVSIAIGTTSCTANASTDVLQARAAYKKEDVIALSTYAKKLESQHHILAPYANYWLLLLDIENTDNQTIASFLEQHSDYAFSERLRGTYLKKLGLQQKWEMFASEYAKYQLDNAAVACYAAEAYHSQPNAGTLASAKHLWLTAKARPNDCGRLYDRMQAEGVIDDNAVWQRFRMALGKNRVSLAKAIVKRSSHYQLSQKKLLSRASASPVKVLKKNLASFNTRFGREVNLYALISLSKKDTWQAMAAFNKVKSKFQAEEVSYFYGMLGLYAAKRHEPEAKLWFQKADFSGLNHEQVSWYARAVLRQGDWTSLLTVINKMKPEIANEARWRYWKARALIARKQNKEEAVGLLTSLAPERHYYGWLAQDELPNFKLKPALLHYAPTQKQVSAIGTLSGVKRAQALFDLDLRWEGKREWMKAMAGFDDKRLLAAAEYANRKQWYDLAVNTADNTKEWHNFSLRYLTPYKGLMKQAANTHHVDLTWVFGITRQESRFMHYAKSHAGAAGLMQLMPTTARWAAKRAGVVNYKRSMIHDLDTNITIGTYYLSHALDVMNGNKIMATAGYNAGPSRAKRWRAGRSLEGAVYAETIPFNETRVYVQRVMANTHMYAKQFGRSKKTLKQRMGIVPAKS